ncbi:MAG TPA: tetratricopeptide repeat protein [Vicinamibacterales bacterium]|nr:tetratricopeptide repeat protein [Vicinamibacterales bacterium]
MAIVAPTLLVVLAFGIGEGGKVGWVPRDVLERPIGLRNDVGHVHEVVTTASKDAQSFYDQGLTLLHSYYWIDAARSFHQALRLDPALAMAHVGLSYVYSGLEDDEAARQELKRAQELRASLTEREQRRVDIRAKQLEAMEDPGSASRLLDYRGAIEAALAKWPDAAELWILAGQASEPSPWGRGQRGLAASIACYEAALARSPDHLAAHHYLTHTYETLGFAERALKHGEVYARLAPGVPHAQHMFAHDLRRVGRIADAIAHFEHTRHLEEEYSRAQQIPPEYDWHYAHNLSLLATGYQYEGRLAAAAEVLKRLFDLPKFLPRFDLTRREWIEFLLGRGRTEEALAAAREMQQAPSPGVRSVARTLSGHALLALNRVADAQRELAEAEREVAAVVVRGPLPITPTMLKPYLDTLRGEILLRTGRGEEGVQLLQQVQGRIRGEPGPDNWIMALFRLDAIARVAREAGHWELAEYSARQMLEHDESYAGAHYALALVADHAGDAETARREFGAAVRLWSSADPDLPELRDARARLAAGTRSAR